MSNKKILLIGAGWYGCHIGLFLKKKGYKVDIFEKKKDIFLGASGYNQFRLHTGYHYPRSSDTIKETKKNFLKFKKMYKNFIFFPKNNIYCIAKQRSLIDSATFKTILKGNKLKLVTKKFNFLKNIEDSYISNEGVLLNEKIKKFYKKKLKENIFFNQNISDIKKFEKKYDYIVDCSNTLFKNYLNENFNYILTISLIYKKKKNSVVYPITIMDGELPSLYPYADKKDLFTLTHSKYTHIKKFRDFSSLEKYKKKIKKEKINEIKKKMEDDMKSFFPKFRKILTYKGYFFSYKVLPNDNSSKRSTFIVKKNNTISCTSPKITNIFSFESYINKTIK